MKNKFFILSIIILVGIVSTVALTANANRSYFVPSVRTNSTASTSPTYISTTGSLSATTTAVLDTFTYAPTAIDSSVLLVQSTASSSASVQKLFIEYSDDGIDYFSDYISTTTSTSNLSINNSVAYLINGNGTASTTRVAISVPTPTRFIKATIVAKTSSSSVWVNWIPKREMVQ